MVSLGQLKMFIGEDKIEKIENLEVDNDIIINGFPRSGTTCIQEMVWLIQNDGDTEMAKQDHVGCRVPFLESHGFDWEKNIESLEEHSHPRIMKSHFPPKTFQPKLEKAKLIIIIRNPKDLVASQHNFYKMAKFIPFDLPLENIFGAFMDEVAYGVLNVFGNYFPWYMQAVPMLEHRNVLLVKFEDMVTNMKATVKHVAAFLGQKMDEDTVAAIAEHCQFNNLKNNPMVNHTDQTIYDDSKGNFFHRGEVGYWKELLTEKQSKQIDKIYKKTLKKAGVELEFESML